MSQDDVHELISALLDDELMPEEQARIEELLLDSAEHRQAFKEMRALRDQIQSLPTHTVRPGFADSVLRQIEQRRLAPEKGTNFAEESDHKSKENDKAVPSRHDTPDSSRGGKRGLVWAALAIAASLLIFLVYGPFNQRPEREAADARVTPSDDQPTKDSTNDKSQLKDLDGEETVGSKLVVNQPAVGVKEELERNADAAEKSPPAPLRRFSSADANRSVETFESKKELLHQRLAVEEAKSGERRLLRGGLGGGGGDDSGRVELCYVVDIPSEAMASGVVEKALGENGIAIIDARDRRIPTQSELGDDEVDILVEGDSRGRFRVSAEEFFFQSDKHGRLKKSLDELADAEVLVLNATPKQIEATLASLQKSGYQWKLHRELRDESESPSKDNGHAGGGTQLGSSQLATRIATRIAGSKDASTTKESDSDDAQPGSSSASRRLEARDAVVKSRKDPLPPKAPSEGNAEGEVAGRPQQKKKADGSYSIPTANSLPIDKVSDSKNENAKLTDLERGRTARPSFAKSAANKPIDDAQQTPRVYAYRLKGFAKEDSVKADTPEKKEESPTAPSSIGSSTSVVPGKDRGNSTKPKPDDDKKRQAEPAAAGPILADAKAAATESAPIVRAIIILRLVPSAPKSEVPKPTP